MRRSFWRTPTIANGERSVRDGGGDGVVASGEFDAARAWIHEAIDCFARRSALTISGAGLTQREPKFRRPTYRSRSRE